MLITLPVLAVTAAGALMYLDYPLRTFVWPGLAPDAAFVLTRLALLSAAGVLAVLPSLAPALGEIGRTQRLFQAVYLPVWYLALNGLTAPAPVVIGVAVVFACLAFAAHSLRHARR
ncbi:hypothetical protein [Amycolatopsis taiwanensis]|uniref:hypothetical protein n=1 Tax=Amycolatopsis taiwanensis TaxID=342230 RepID=UPI000484134D|nr:hypothetical protein [Amycolatopsis taiwanensis]